MTFLSKLLAGIAVTSSTVGIGILKTLGGLTAVEESDSLKTAENGRAEEDVVKQPEDIHAQDASLEGDTVNSSKSLEEGQEKEKKEIRPALKLVPAKKRCLVFLIESGHSKKLSAFDWEEKRRNDPLANVDKSRNGNKQFWDDVQGACEKKKPHAKDGKVYVSAGSGGRWSYSSTRQTSEDWSKWSLISES